MWTANLFQVTTGTIGPQINFKDVSWSVSLNSIETLSMEVSKADLPNANLDLWLSPWWSGVLLRWNEVPVFAGPIVSIPSESFYSFRVECKGIRAILERRFVITEQDDWARLAASKVSYGGVTFGTIARRVVQLSMAKPGGYLPISFPIAEAAAVADSEHQRNYQGFNLSNITCDDVLTKLSEVTNGPDIMFLPRLIDGNSLTFDMWYGLSDADPTIPQKITPVWDTTAVSGFVSDLDMTTTGSYQTNRVFVTGDGTNAALKIKMSMDNGPLVKGYPLLETVESYGSVKSLDVLQSHAKANLAQNAKKLVEIQMTVRADGQNRLGSFWPGNRAQIVVKGWRSLTDGTHNVRILNINGSDNENIRMSMQTEA